MGGTPRTYRSTVGAAADVMFSAPVGRHFRLGASWSVQAGLGNTDDCVVPQPVTPGSGCLTRLPLVTSWSALAGRDWQLSPSVSLRVYAGPSLVSVYRKTSYPYYWSSMGGVSGRVDVVIPGRPNVVASIRGALVPALPNASGTVAFGLGFGLH